MLCIERELYAIRSRQLLAAGSHRGVGQMFRIDDEFRA